MFDATKLAAIRYKLRLEVFVFQNMGERLKGIRVGTLRTMNCVDPEFTLIDGEYPGIQRSTKVYTAVVENNTVRVTRTK